MDMESTYFQTVKVNMRGNIIKEKYMAAGITSTQTAQNTADISNMGKKTVPVPTPCRANTSILGNLKTERSMVTAG